MTIKLEQAAQQALEALEFLSKNTHFSEYATITALREALAETTMRKATRDEKIVRPGVYEVPAEQAKQEPVAWLCDGELYEVQQYDWRTDLPFPNQTPLYATPVRTKDPTDDEIAKWFGVATEGSLISFARAVIVADREKNK